MFAVGDLVQPRAGGPKLKVVEVQGEQLVVVQAAQEQGERAFRPPMLSNVA